MEASDLINYKEQVATIEAALQEDPTNEELLTLKTELLELITLTETLLQQEHEQQQQQQQQASQATAAAAEASSESSSHTAAAAASSHAPVHSPPSNSGSGSGSGFSTPNHPSSTTKPAPESNQPIYQPPAPVRHWSVGDRCKALYQDGKFYEAKIVAVGGGGQVYTVAFKGYESSPPALVGPQDLKAIYDPKKHQKHDHNKAGAAAATTTTANATNTATAAVASSVAGDGSLTQKKRGLDHAGGDGGPKKKKSGGQASEQVQKQMAWQNFSKGGAKKTKGPVLKKSIFATPDNPEGKVGVVGSGKGMTSFQQRGKHIYGSAPPSR